MDPVEGGTSNDYAYVEDPINAFDLTGTNCWGYCQAMRAAVERMVAPLAKVHDHVDRADQWSRRNGVYKLLAMRAYGMAMKAGGFWAGGPAGVIGAGGWASMVQYRTCGKGLITCRSGRSDARGQIMAVATGGLSGAAKGYKAIPKFKEFIQSAMRKVF